MYILLEESEFGLYPIRDFSVEPNEKEEYPIKIFSNALKLNTYIRLNGLQDKSMEVNLNKTIGT